MILNERTLCFLSLSNYQFLLIFFLTYLNSIILNCAFDTHQDNLQSKFYISLVFDSNSTSAKLGQIFFFNLIKWFPISVFTSINSADDEIKIFWHENVMCSKCTRRTLRNDSALIVFSAKWQQEACIFIAVKSAYTYTHSVARCAC